MVGRSDQGARRRIGRGIDRDGSGLNWPVYPLPFGSGHGLGVHLHADYLAHRALGPTARYQAAG